MGKEDIIEVTGIVVESLPNTEFKVEINDEEHEEFKKLVVNARLSGKMRMHYIKILPGDRVTVQLSTYDLTKGRITYRQK